MKILIASAKTQNIKDVEYINQKIIFEKQSKIIKSKLKSLTLEQEKAMYKCSQKVLEDLHSKQKEKNFGDAFFSFDGLVYKNAKQNISSLDFDYIKDNVLIIDSLHGILQPFTKITNYRLDFLTRIPNYDNFYKIWTEYVNDYLKDEVIINLMSKEFSKLMMLPMITINFVQIKNEKEVSQSTHCKIARGTFVNWMIKNKINDVTKLTNFNELEYLFDPSSSDLSTLTFKKII